MTSQFSARYTNYVELIESSFKQERGVRILQPHGQMSEMGMRGG